MAGLAGSLAAILDDVGLAPGEMPTPSPESVWTAILGSFLASPKVDPVLCGLRDADLIEPSALAHVDPAEIAEAAGLAHGHSAIAPLRKVARWLADRGGLGGTTEALRDELRGLRGVGPTLVETILLRGLGRAGYPVDRATYRVLVRHAWIEPEAGVDEVRAEILGAAEAEPAVLSALADAMDVVGSRWCKPSVARCERCPLASLLPEGGPRGAADGEHFA